MRQAGRLLCPEAAALVQMWRLTPKSTLPLPHDDSKVILTEHLIFDQRNRTGGAKSYARMWPKLRVYPGGRNFLYQWGWRITGGVTARCCSPLASQPSLTSAPSVSVLLCGFVSCSSDVCFPEAG